MFPADVGVHLLGMRAPHLCNFGKESQVECCQNRIYIWSISAVFSWALGRGDIDPVVGKHPLEFSFYRVFPSFGDPYILKADYGGPLFKYLVYFLLAPLVSMGSHIP